jgi:uncharacterized tellurite resistance protein B-like protein
MLNRIFDLFTPQSLAPEGGEASPGERVQLATCVLLLEVAGSDDEFSAAECQRVIDILRDRFDLEQEDAEELINVAQERRSQSYDLFRFTSQINENCSKEEKKRIIEEVWRVVFADGRLDGHEDYMVHKMARLMNLNHPELIEAKMRVTRDGD